MQGGAGRRSQRRRPNNALDPLLILQITVEMISCRPEEQNNKADVDGNGRIDPADALLVASKHGISFGERSRLDLFGCPEKLRGADFTP